MSRCRTLLVLALVGAVTMLAAPYAVGDLGGSFDGPATRGSVALRPGSAAFGDVTVTDTVTMVLRIKNNTNGKAQVSGTFPTDGPFVEGGFDDGGCWNFGLSVVLAKGGSCTTRVRFTPTTEGRVERALVLEVRGSTGVVGHMESLSTSAPISRKNVTLSGTGVPPKSTFEPASFPFGTVPAGEFRVRIVEVRNNSPFPLQYTVETPAGFSRYVPFNPANVPQCQTDVPAGSRVIEPGRSCDVMVAFQRAEAGPWNGQVTVRSYRAPVDATGTWPVSGPVLATKRLNASARVPRPTFEVSPDDLFFRPVALNGTYIRTVTLTNTSDIPVRFRAETHEAGPFTVLPGGNSPECFNDSGQSRVVGPGQSCGFRVAFHSDVPGEFVAGVYVGNFFTDDPVGQFGDWQGNPGYFEKSVRVRAHVAAPDFKVAPASVAFGRVRTGSEPYKTVTVTNQSDRVLQFALAAPVGPFYRRHESQAGYCQADILSPSQSLAVPPGGTCRLTVGFSPFVARRMTAVARLDVWVSTAYPNTYGAPAGPVVATKDIHLSGTGY